MSEEREPNQIKKKHLLNTNEIRHKKHFLDIIDEISNEVKKSDLSQQNTSFYVYLQKISELLCRNLYHKNRRETDNNPILDKNLNDYLCEIFKDRNITSYDEVIDDYYKLELIRTIFNISSDLSSSTRKCRPLLKLAAVVLHDDSEILDQCINLSDPELETKYEILKKFYNDIIKDSSTNNAQIKAAAKKLREINCDVVEVNIRTLSLPCRKKKSFYCNYDKEEQKIWSNTLGTYWKKNDIAKQKIWSNPLSIFWSKKNIEDRDVTPAFNLELTL